MKQMQKNTAAGNFDFSKPTIFCRLFIEDENFRSEAALSKHA